MARWLCVVLLLALANASTWSADERRTPLEPPKPKPTDPTAVPVPDQTPPKKEGETAPPDENKKLISVPLKGLRLISKADEVVKQADFSGLEIVNIPLIDTPDFRAKFDKILGGDLTMKAIREISQIIILKFRELDHPFVNISVPEQDITKGCLQLMIVEGTVGKISVENNKWWRTKQYLQNLRLKSGDYISEKRLIQDIDYINQNSFRSVKPVFKKGDQPGTTDLTLQAEERFPVRVYTGYEDSGLRVTGYDRLFYGFNWNNAFMHDHEIGYQFTTDLHFSKYWDHSGYWRIPLPNRDKLAFNFSWSEVKAEINSDFETRSFDQNYGMRYIKSLPRIGNFMQELQAGLDFKESRNILRFGPTELFDHKFHIAQFAVQYAGQEQDKTGLLSFSMRGIYSPGHMVDHQELDDFRASRAGTDNKYHYGQISIERDWYLPKEITLVTKATAQLSSARLLSTEQIQFGGYASVRGYDDRIVAADQGVQFTAELRSPNWLLGKIAKKNEFESRFQLLTFFDYATANNQANFPGERKHTELRSVGAGARFKIGSHLSIRVDYGFQLKELKDDADNEDNSRIHLGVTGSF